MDSDIIIFIFIFIEDREFNYYPNEKFIYWMWSAATDVNRVLICERSDQGVKVWRWWAERTWSLSGNTLAEQAKRAKEGNRQGVHRRACQRNGASHFYDSLWHSGTWHMAHHGLALGWYKHAKLHLACGSVVTVLTCERLYVPLYS